MKKITLMIFVLFLSTKLFSQKIELKKDIITIDGKDVFSFKKSNGEISIYKLNTKEELIFIRHNNNGTPGQPLNGDDYNNINFISLKLKMETKTWHLRWKSTIAWLYENGVITIDGEVNAEKVSLFIEKYNENLSGK